MLHDETVWLTQKGMQELFEKAKSTISEHIKNVFEEGELNEEVVVRDFRTTSPHGAIEGKTQENTVKYYNLDVIISVGYRVKRCFLIDACLLIGFSKMVIRFLFQNYPSQGL